MITDRASAMQYAAILKGKHEIPSAHIDKMIMWAAQVGIAEWLPKMMEAYKTGAASDINMVVPRYIDYEAHWTYVMKKVFRVVKPFKRRSGRKPGRPPKKKKLIMDKGRAVGIVNEVENEPVVSQEEK